MRFHSGRDEDPFGRRTEADDAIRQATGLPEPAIRPITGILYGPACDDLCRLLPGVERSNATRLLILVCAAAAKLSVEAAAHRPGLSPAHAGTAALPGMLLYALTSELMRRHDLVGTADIAAPTPTGALREFHQRLVKAPIVHPVARSAGRAIGDAVSAAERDPATLAWGGWAMAAAVTVLDIHRDRLPEPGRVPGRSPGAAQAGYAFQIGREALAAAALSLVRE